MQHLHHFGVIIAGPCIPYRLNARLGVVQIRIGQEWQLPLHSGLTSPGQSPSSEGLANIWRSV